MDCTRGCAAISKALCTASGDSTSTCKGSAAAAAVATLPAQEQVSAALGGKEELQQAAKRVRETRKRSKAEEPEGQLPDTLAALQARVAELEQENASLRAQLAALSV